MTTKCDFGVGCDESGACFAEANGRPEMCGRDDIAKAVEEAERRTAELIAARARFLAGSGPEDFPQEVPVREMSLVLSCLKSFADDIDEGNWREES